MAKKIRLFSWNVNGIRAIIKKGFFDWFESQKFDILSLQETKISDHQLTSEMTARKGYKSFWSHADKAGYSGTVTYCKEKPTDISYGFGIDEFDNEGRIVTTQFKRFTLLNIYYPNGSRGERLDYKLRFYDALLEHAQELRAQGQSLVLCGDFNTSHKEIDLARPKQNRKTSGFLPVECEWMDKFVAAGFVDSFREFHPEPERYSWWSFRSGARERNVGWRLDYFFVSDDLKDNLADAEIHPDVMGSDHCPVSLTLKF